MLFVGAAEFALSENGSLIYAPGRFKDTRGSGRFRRPRRTLGDAPRNPAGFDGPEPFARWSSAGAQVGGGALESIWIYEIDRGTWTRWTSEWDNFRPVWAPSGREIAFASARASELNLYKRPLDGSGRGASNSERADFLRPGLPMERSSPTMKALPRREPTSGCSVFQGRANRSPS